METADLAKTRYIYIVFSSTQGKMGKMIRLVTDYPYNHVSLALDEKLQTFYSFARHYKNTPLYGGFIEESSLRYTDENQPAILKICKIPVSEEEFSQLKNKIDEMKRREKQYVYNTLSAVSSAFHHKITIRNAYTCVEFVADLLVRCGIEVGLNPYRFTTIEAFDKLLADKVIFEGRACDLPCISASDWGNDLFCERQTYAFYIAGTTKNFSRLIYRLVRRKGA